MSFEKKEEAKTLAIESDSSIYFLQIIPRKHCTCRTEIATTVWANLGGCDTPKRSPF